MSQSSASRMMSLFAGNTDGYGTYDHTRTATNETKGGKVEIKKTADTRRGAVTAELWSAHLEGRSPLGVIPIRNDGLCRWGCIDVDKYDLSLVQVVAQIEKRGLPLVLCRTKSGGAHLFLFLKEWEPAAMMQSTLREMAASLGFGGSEIFPKQTQLLTERGDLGNWLNMPYFGGDATDRYALKRTGAVMTVTEFLRHAESARTNLDDVQVRPPRRAAAASSEDDGLEDGPPCLQHLTGSGFPEGTRNNGLFALGVFCKKKFVARWKDVLEQYNQQFMSPPLTSEEVVEVERNLDRKEYNYRCSDSPLAQHCNSALCRTRLHGVGGGDDYPVISGLSVLDTEPPLWFLDINGERVELSTDQLQNYRLFQKVCMERLRVCYLTLKNDTWHKMVGGVMQSVVKIEAPPEASTTGYFLELLEEFCVNRHRAETQEGILQGKPWTDEETGRHYFRLSDFMRYLEREKFSAWGRNKVASTLRELGGKEFFNIKGKGANVMWVPGDFSAPPPGPLPRKRRDAI